MAALFPLVERRAGQGSDVIQFVIAYLLPKDINLNHRNLDDLTDDQLMRKMAMLTEMARPLLAKLPVLEGQAVEIKPAEQAAPLLARVAENDGEDGAKPAGLRH
jgi:hypothetical protein